MTATIGKVIKRSDSHGICYLAGGAFIPDTKLLCDEAYFRRVNFNIKIFRDEIEVGTMYSATTVVQHYSDIYLLGHIRFNPKEEFKSHYLLPIWAADKIQCGTCNRIYSKGDVLCRCAKGAPVLNLIEYQISHMLIFSALDYKVERADQRKKVLQGFEGGLLNSMLIVDE
jgi:hypothetical protein